MCVCSSEGEGVDSLGPDTHISGDFDLFFPLKNSGRARLSISWILREREMNTSNYERFDNSNLYPTPIIEALFKIEYIWGQDN